jgi:nucleotide-binding universal stress UspA family protein
VFHLATCSCVTVHHSDEQPALDGIKNILVATDGSEQADKAVELASDIAARYGAKLGLLYVASRGPSLEKLRDSIDMAQLSDSAREELDPERHPIAEHVSSTFIPPVVSKETSKEIGEQVLERGRQSAEAKGLSGPKLMLLDGDDPARAIAGATRHEHVDLIAMGSRGLGGVEGLLTGSVSYKVSHTVPCSCMIIR